MQKAENNVIVDKLINIYLLFKLNNNLNNKRNINKKK
jgi:hypothetical protein